MVENGGRGAGQARVPEPIAIIGMACRFPGSVASPEDLWEFVAAGRVAVSEFPTDRGWDFDRLHATDGLVDRGGFLDAAGFDAGFFNISPREATAMHPEQRILLEVAWEACERARIAPTTLRDTNVGVFAARLSTEYGPPMHAAPPDYAGLVLTGTTPSAISGRIAYTLGLTGPAITVDTASSGSLVAIHLAVQALRAAECDLALAGGVTIAPTPGLFTEFSRQRGLAPDGLVKPFSADADGTVWSEGAGLLLLTRLSDARRRGAEVLAVVRGSAVNQDGATASLAVPSAVAQERLIGRALANAGLAAADIDALEAHGSGTRAGDRAEAQAILAAYGRGRPAGRPLWVGSVKSNLGHAQAAAGVAGVIKMVEAMRHGLLPASLHIGAPTPQVDWDAGAVRLLTEPVDWPRSEGLRRAAVSSFGIAGTNAHLILEEPPQAVAAPAPVPTAGATAWVLSARTPEALRGQAQALVARLAGRPERPVDVGWSLAATRSVFEHRAVVVGQDRAELTAGVAALASGRPHPNLVHFGAAALGDTGPGPVLVFPGQGSQWAGMGAELLASSAAFAERIADCERALAPHVDWSLTEVLRGDGAELGRVDVVQPVLWAVMVSLAAVWKSFGVVPAAVVGHSQGEIAAACVAGALSVEDAAKVVAVRSRALRRLAGAGAMASLGIGVDETARYLTADAVGVAAVNGPSAVVISGPPEPVAAVVARVEADGLRARLVEVDYASHGPQVDQITDELRRLLAGVTPSSADVAFYSTVTGGRVDTAALDTGYWVSNLREQVRFADAIRMLLADGYRIFIEAAPHPVLILGIQETIDAAGIPAAVIPTLRRDHGDDTRVAHALAHAFTVGAAVDWARRFPADPAPQAVDLPTYAFQRQRYWLTGPGHTTTAETPAAQPDNGREQKPATAPPALTGRRDVWAVLTGEIAAVLGLPAPSQVPAGPSFKELGFESMTGVELRNRLCGVTGLRLPSTLIYDYPSPQRLADYLFERLAPDDSGDHDRAAAAGAVGTNGGDRALDDMDGDELVRLALGKLRGGDAG
jgi:acyl transferase domain-containing protein